MSLLIEFPKYWKLNGSLGWRSGQGAALLVGRSRDRFFSDIFPPTVPWPWSRLSPSENE
jgi:hypothetical protein